MPILQIHTFPDTILKSTAHQVSIFDDALRETADSMLETMYENKGIGLAAIQVAIPKQIVVIDIMAGSEDEAERDPQVFINPSIKESRGETTSEEGCLSVIEFRAEVKRAENVVMIYQDLNGVQHTLEAEGLKAICIQHELDHLQGILFIDHLPSLKQKMVKKRLAKVAVEA